MKESKIIIYDGSFNGFLTAIFYAFKLEDFSVVFQKNSHNSTTLFNNSSTIFTDITKAQHVWEIIQTKNSNAIKNIYFAFLSEEKQIENKLFLYIKNIFHPNLAIQMGYSLTLETKLETLAKKVSQEKIYIEKTIILQSSKDGISFANIAPKNDIIPLLSKYFRLKYKGKSWLLFDVKRNYGIYYNGYQIENISLEVGFIYKNMFSSVKNKQIEKIKILNNYFTLNYINTLILNKLNSTNNISISKNERLAV